MEDTRQTPDSFAAALRTLWLGLLLPPVAWALQMQTNYWEVRGACARSSRIALLGASGVGMLLIVIAVAISLQSWRSATADSPKGQNRVETRLGFLAAVSLFSCLMFFLAIVAQALAVLTLHPCQT